MDKINCTSAELHEQVLEVLLSVCIIFVCRHKIGYGSAMTTNLFDCHCTLLALSLYALSLNIARYAFGKVPY